MCTVSVITRNHGYLLAMNRDESIARGAGEPPEIHQLRGTAVIYPSDGAGGTWISANEYGITLALLNWNDVTQPVLNRSKIRSRGQIIPALASASSLAALQAAFGALDLEGIRPFRLVGVFPQGTIGHWSWDSAQLAFHTHGWQSRHWFSSSLSDRQARSLRGAACQNARYESDSGSEPWLRRLHASHAGAAGPFSLCVHRDGVRTLSYSEVMVTPAALRMGYFRGSPCTMDSIHSMETKRSVSPDLEAWALAGR